MRHLLTRFAAPQPKAVQDAIAELLPDIDLLATWGTIVAVVAKKLVPPTLPVVIHAVGDPVAIGLVESLSRPGGNMTGITVEAAMEMYGKKLEFLKVIVPALGRVAVLRATGDVNAVPAMSALDQAARQLGINLVVFDFSSPDQLVKPLEVCKRAASRPSR
jgi:putative ABC transport system substrate-binding protein